MSITEFDLNSIQVKSPCTVSWATMTGDERARFCRLCKLNVYNLSGMTKAEATELLQAKEGKLCVRYIKRADGTVLTKDCGPVRASRMRRKIAFAVATGAMLLINTMIWVQSRRRTESSSLLTQGGRASSVYRARQSKLYKKSIAVRKSVDWIDKSLNADQSDPFVMSNVVMGQTDQANW